MLVTKPNKLSRGGSFLVEPTANDVFSPEDLSEEHRAVAKTADEFWLKEVEPQLESIQRHEPGLIRNLLQKSAELGFTAVTVPEKFGGMELDLASDFLVAESLSRDGSYAASHGAHAGIGTLPLLYFGTEEQKQKYLPRLATAEMVSAYALSEPQAGSDALAALTRADLNAEGTHYILNGQKMWITNGGIADLFTVFAKVGGEKFTAFLVERSFPGVSSGAEEKKMGIIGSSTTALYLDNVPVPVANVLGEIGRGHVIAFNILNSGRLKLGAGVLGSAKSVLAASLKYAKERKAFGRPIAEFGAIQHKLAEMAIRIYAAESVAWRTVGLIQDQMDETSSSALEAFEEFAIECSIVKVYASEMLDYVADEGVQIHGGYGFHQDYMVERAYRDSRINRIFEGTNEINRLLIPGLLLKRAARGQLPLLSAAESLSFEPEADEEKQLVAKAKKVALFGIAIAHRKYAAQLEQQQEVLVNIADVIIEAFAMESSLLRSRKSARQSSTAMCEVFLRDSMGRIESSARNIVGACGGGEDVKLVRRLTRFEPVNSVEKRRAIANRLLAQGKYVV
ncbi:MAG: acyl-CoA dehydrogenase family protein [Acidobacteriota bacterium]|nr:acyl-CoA dehydrogenase family protein [Acidobacteriota bacterium]